MKIRSSYVSNSSSSSFIITKDLNNKGLICLKLSKEQIKLINGSVVDIGYQYPKEIELDLAKDYWLTEFIQYDDEKYDKIMMEKHYIIYCDGTTYCTPYDPKNFNEYTINSDSSVYIKKEHDKISN